ncbi:hypothetical protein D3C71_1010110 [compost metagenome]
MGAAHIVAVGIGVFDHAAVAALRAPPGQVELLCFVDLTIGVPLQADAGGAEHSPIDDDLRTWCIFANGDVQAARGHFAAAGQAVFATTLLLVALLHEVFDVVGLEGDHIGREAIARQKCPRREVAEQVLALMALFLQGQRTLVGLVLGTQDFLVKVAVLIQPALLQSLQRAEGALDHVVHGAPCKAGTRHQLPYGWGEFVRASLQPPRHVLARRAVRAEEPV